MATIGEVAHEAGVSLSTVSRVFTAPELVNARTRERVAAVADRLGYQPNRLARASAQIRSSTIGLIVPDIANPFFPPIIKAVQARARLRGRVVLLADTDEHVTDEVELGRVMAKQVDGLLIASPRTPADRLTELRRLVPVVFVNRDIPDAPSVIVDNAEGMQRAVQLLHALGHRRIAYLAGPRSSWSNQQRRAAVREESERLGIDVSEYGPFEPQVQSGRGAGDLLYGSGITGVIAYDDMIALGVMARLSERGLRPGDDVSVIGVDDSPMAALAEPGLTTVHVPGAQAGAAAVDLLLDVLAEPGTTESVQLDTHLVVRGSTGPVPVASSATGSPR